MPKFWYWQRSCELTVSPAVARETGLKAGNMTVKKSKITSDLAKGVLKEVSESGPKTMTLVCGEDTKYLAAAPSCAIHTEGKKRVVSVKAIAKKMKAGRLLEVNKEGEGEEERQKVECPRRTFWVTKVE